MSDAESELRAGLARAANALTVLSDSSEPDDVAAFADGSTGASPAAVRSPVAPNARASMDYTSRRSFFATEAGALRSAVDDNREASFVLAHAESYVNADDRLAYSDTDLNSQVSAVSVSTLRLDDRTQAAFQELVSRAEGEVWDAVSTNLRHSVSTFNQDADLLLLALATQQQQDPNTTLDELGQLYGQRRGLTAARALASIHAENPLLGEFVTESAAQHMDAHRGSGVGPEDLERDFTSKLSSFHSNVRLSVAERWAEYQPNDFVSRTFDEEASSVFSDGIDGRIFESRGERINQSAPPTIVGIQYKSRRSKAPNYEHGGYDSDPGDHKELQSASAEHARVGVGRCAFNLANDIVGAGAITVPYFVIHAGFYTGMVLLLASAIASFSCLMLIHHVTLKRGVFTFSEMAYLAFGRPGLIGSALAVFCFNYGVFVGNLLMLGQLAQKLAYLAYSWADTSEPTGFWAFVMNFRVVVIVCVLATSPMTFFKSMDRFARLSFLCTAAVAFMFVTVIYATAQRSDDLVWSRLNPSGAPIFDAVGALQGLGGIFYLFTCHDLSFHVVHTLQKPTRARYAVVAGLAVGFSFVLFFTMAFCGQILFGDDIDSNMLLNFKGSGENSKHGMLVVDLVRLAVVVNIALNIPFFTFMPRVGLLSLLQLEKPEWVRARPGESAMMATRYVRVRHLVHVASTVLVLFLVTGVALTGISLGAVFGVTGGVAGISISLLIPITSWLKIRSITNRQRHQVLTSAQAPLWTAQTAAADAERNPKMLEDDDSGSPVRRPSVARNTEGQPLLGVDARSPKAHHQVELWRKLKRRAKVILAWFMIAVAIICMCSICVAFVV